MNKPHTTTYPLRTFYEVEILCPLPLDLEWAGEQVEEIVRSKTRYRGFFYTTKRGGDFERDVREGTILYLRHENKESLLAAVQAVQDHFDRLIEAYESAELAKLVDRHLAIPEIHLTEEDHNE